MDLLEKTRSLVDTWSNPDRWSADEREQARLQITNLSDVDFLEPLKQIVAQKQDAVERKTTYWMLDSLLFRSKSTEVAEFIMCQIGVEKDKTLKRQLLLSLASVRGSDIKVKDASNCLACLPDKLLFQESISALGCCSDPRAEEAVTEVIENILKAPSARQSASLFESIATLCEIGSKRSVPLILGVLGKIDQMKIGLKGHIKAMLIKFLARHDGSSHVELFSQLLGDKSPQTTWHAMHALRQYATLAQRPQVERRIKTIISAPRLFVQEDLLFLRTAGEDNKKTELLLALHTLVRVGGPDSELTQILKQKSDSLTEEELACVSSF